jgi:hypothetical protein
LECKTFLKRTAVEATLYIRFTTHRLLQSDEQIATAVGFSPSAARFRALSSIQGAAFLKVERAALVNP